MDRRTVLERIARGRAAIRRQLTPALEARAIRLWNRIQFRYRRRRADVVLVSYPKAGRTWLALMLARALEDTFDIERRPDTDLEALHDADQRVPRVFLTHDRIMPRTTPAQVRRDKSMYRGQSVILLVRDPRDVVVSEYHHLRNRMKKIDVGLDEFVLGNEAGIDTVVAFYQAWRDALSVPRRLLVVRYEDLHRDSAGELARVLAFLGITPRASHLAAAVESGSFASMKRIEREGTSSSAALRTDDPERESAYKVRRGAIGGYRLEVSDVTRERLDATLRAAGLGCFGYDR